MPDFIIPFTSVGGYSTGLTASLIIEEEGGVRVNTTQGATFTGLLTTSGGLSASGGITLNGTVTGATATFNRLTTLSGGVSASGGTFSSQLNAQNFKVLTVGGDEGGQVDFGIPATNTSLTGGVAIDVYQNKLRFFETGGTSRGAYLDLTGSAAGAATDILGVQTFNGATGAVKQYSTYLQRHESRSGSTAQSDFIAFTDFVSNNFSSSIAQGEWLGANANGGSFTISTASTTSYGFDKCNGVINFITGTTSNTTGYAACLLHASLLPGIVTPSDGYITKYELECRFMTDSDVTSQTTETRIGFADAWTNATPADGVYFGRLYNGTVNETSFQVVFRNGGSEERIDTGVAFSTSTIYRTYLCLERNTSGTVTTTWEILNDTTAGVSGGTAAPSNTARLPTGTTDYINPGCVIGKTGSVATATSRLIRVDYIGARIRRPLNRDMKLFA